MTGPEEAVLADLEALDAVLFPHLVQKAVPSGSSAPQ
jgi:hypothetical protein